MENLLHDADIFVTGGAGTLGRALAKLRQQEKWVGKLTVYSTDDHKHDVMRRMFPRESISYIQGDIRNLETLANSIIGHDVVIHAAAVKVIPVSEEWSIDTIDVNVYGSQNVCVAAVRAGVDHVLGISTDKACHPANLYGATKMAMEKIFQEYARLGHKTQFHLVRYGNVLESTGSVIEQWKKATEAGSPIKVTDPTMTRFWLSPMQAARYVVEAFNFESGDIYVPKMPALSIGKLAEYTAGEVDWERVPMRPGEKINETLVTCEERYRAADMGEYFIVLPSTTKNGVSTEPPYSSDVARQLTEDDLTALLANE